jgi:hypothetical protein
MSDQSNPVSPGGSLVASNSAEALREFGPEFFSSLPESSENYIDSIAGAFHPEIQRLRAEGKLFSPLLKIDKILPSGLEGKARPPKNSFTQDILIRKSGYLVTIQDGKFHYYGCPVEDVGNFFAMKKPPPVISDALFIKDKEIYFVMERDVRRRHIRKARKLPLKKSTITYDDILSHNVLPVAPSKPARGDSSTQSSPQIAGLGADSSDSDLGGSPKLTENQEQKEIDVAFEEQIRTLLGNPFEEIEWDTSQDSQPQSNSASGSISDPDFFT